jgi:hypothetical protein
VPDTIQSISRTASAHTPHLPVRSMMSGGYNHTACVSGSSCCSLCILTAQLCCSAQRQFHASNTQTECKSQQNETRCTAAAARRCMAGRARPLKLQVGDGHKPPKSSLHQVQIKSHAFDMHVRVICTTQRTTVLCNSKRLPAVSDCLLGTGVCSQTHLHQHAKA